MSKCRFTLWLKVERPLISTNQIAGNQGYGFSTLHTRGQRPKVVTFQNTYMAGHFDDKGDGLSKEVWVGQEWRPKLWSRGCRFLSLKKSKTDKILTIRLEELF
jgi:hypothetical protein